MHPSDPEVLSEGSHSGELSDPRSLRRSVLKVDGLPNLPVRIGDHLPGQEGYLLGPESGFDGQEEDDPIPFWVTGLSQVGENGLDLTFGQNLSLATERHDHPPTDDEMA